MGPLSLDLRKRVISAVTEDGMSCRAAARRFGVSFASAIRWVASLRERGEYAPLPISPLRKCRFQFAVGARRMVTTSAAGSASMSAIRPKTSSELVCKTKMKAARASAASLGVP